MILVDTSKNYLYQARACVTIAAYGLNEHSRPDYRKKIYKQLLAADPADYNDYSYRFLVEF